MKLQQGPFDSTRPFSRADALAAGIAPHQLLGVRYQRVFFDVYLSSSIKLGSRERARAALAISGPDAFVSHHTAARLWGACVPDSEHVHVSIRNEHVRPVRRGIQSHRAIDVDPVVAFRGIPMASPGQCFLEMAALGTGLVDLVVMGDSLVRAGRISVDELLTLVSSWSGRGAKRARRAARWVRMGVDSPMESRLRMLIVLAGLPEPEVNLIIRGDNGEWLMRFDLCYSHLKLIVEYDGRQHGDDAGQWKHDTRRREKLDTLGWRKLVIYSDGIYVDPQETLDRVRDALVELGQTGLGRQYRSEWTQYFSPRKELV